MASVHLVRSFALCLALTAALWLGGCDSEKDISSLPEAVPIDRVAPPGDGGGGGGGGGGTPGASTCVFGTATFGSGCTFGP